jgi:helicase MOV-10
MNVALTRAKFGLIVIGKKDVLAVDKNWKEFLDFCDRNGLVTEIPDDGIQLEGKGDVKLTRLEKVLLAQERDMEQPEILGGIHQDDEMWTAGMQAALDDDMYKSEYEYEEN